MTPFETRIRTRGYELDPSRTVPAPVLFSYLEHLRWETMQDPALGVLEHVHEGHFFVVLDQILEVNRRVGMGVDLTARAVLGKVGRSVAWVHHEIIRESDGALVARARVRGAWMGPNRRLARIPDAMREVSRAHESLLAQLVTPDTRDVVLPSPFPGSWFHPPEVQHAPVGLDVEPPKEVPGSIVHEWEVGARDVDVFDHVNAATYLRFLDDVRHDLGVDSPVQRVALGYRQQAFRGDRLAARVHPLSEHVLLCSIERDEVVCCTCRLEVSRRAAP